MKQEEHLLTYKFEWDDENNRFHDHPSPNFSNSFGFQREILEVVNLVESKSGVKKRPLYIYAILFLALVVLGFGAGFLLIYKRAQQLGSVILMITPFSVFFCVVGLVIVAGTQTERIDFYMAENEEEINELLAGTNCSISHSFHRGKPSFSYFLAERYFDKIENPTEGKRSNNQSSNCFEKIGSQSYTQGELTFIYRASKSDMRTPDTFKNGSFYSESSNLALQYDNEVSYFEASAIELAEFNYQENNSSYYQDYSHLGTPSKYEAPEQRQLSPSSFYYE